MNIKNDRKKLRVFAYVRVGNVAQIDSTIKRADELKIMKAKRRMGR